MSDGQCNVNFHNLPSGKGRVSEVCLTTLLKPLPGSKKKMKLDTSQSGFGKGGSKGDSSARINTKQKRQQLQQQKEYLWKKKQKKQSRLKELEEEREQVKNKWQQFNEKVGFLNFLNCD